MDAATIKREMAALAAALEAAERDEREAAERAEREAVAARLAPVLGHNPLSDDGGPPDPPNLDRIIAALGALARAQAMTTHMRNDPCGLEWQGLANAVTGEPPPAVIAPVPPPAVAANAADVDYHRGQLDGARQRSDAGAMAFHTRELARLGVQV